VARCFRNASSPAYAEYRLWYHLALPVLHVRNERSEILNTVAKSLKNDNRNRVSAQVLLMRNPLIRCKEYVEGCGCCFK
jgi:hypothetical protein